MPHNCPISQFDVKNVFFHVHVHETVYMHQHPKFLEPFAQNHLFMSLNKLQELGSIGLHNLLFGFDLLTVIITRLFVSIGRALMLLTSFCK